jgi:hypothetical protein
MPEQMSAEIEQAGARATAASSPEGQAGDGNGAPVPQVVAAPGIDAASPIVRTEVLPAGAAASSPAVVGVGKGGGARLVLGGYVSAVVGFVLVIVVPRIKSNVVGRTLLVMSVAMLVVGAALVTVGFVRETVKRL